MVVERGGGLNGHFLSRCRTELYMGQWTHEIAKLIVICQRWAYAYTSLFFIAADKPYSPAPNGFA